MQKILKITNPFHIRLMAGLLLVLCGVVFSSLAMGADSFLDARQRELSPAAHQVLATAQSLAAKKKERKALAKIEKFRREHPQPDYLLVEFMAGNLQFSLEQFTAAAVSYQRAVTLAPEFLPARENLGMTLLSLREYRQAGKQFAAATALARNMDTERLDNLLKYAGTSWLMVPDYEKAQPFFSELVEQRHDFSRESVQSLVRIYLELRRHKAAEQLLARVLGRFPADAGYWNLLGRVRLGTTEYASALAAYKVMLVLKTPEARDFKIVAQLYQLLGVPAAAGRALEQAYQSRQSSLTAAEMEQLVALYLQAGDNDRALDWLRRKQTRYPSSKNLLQRGEILYRTGRYKEAYHILSGLTSLAEKQGYQFLLAGYCAWYADDLPAARLAFRRAAHYKRYHQRSLELISTLEMIESSEHSPVPAS